MSEDKSPQQGGIDQLFFGSVTVGDRGQVVIPAEGRATCDINPGDKLLAFYNPLVDGIMLVKVDKVSGILQLLGRMVQEMAGFSEPQSTSASASEG